MVDENRATQVYTDRINQLMNQEANSAHFLPRLLVLIFCLAQDQ